MSSNNKICVISASNSETENKETIDYIQLASIAAERVKYYLGIPTFIITSNPELASQYTNFEKVIYHEPIKITKRGVIAGEDSIKYTWLNDARVDAYNLTKGLADKIIMIDADYMIASDQLLSWLHVDYPFLILDNVYDVSGSGIFNQKYLPSNDIIQRWATVMCWNQSEEAKIIFDTARMVRDNYEFYALMFNFPRSPFRNDLAFSVSCHLHNVVTMSNTRLFNLAPGAKLHKTKDTSNWIIDFNDKVFRWNTDIHILNKKYAIDKELMNTLRIQNVKA